MEWPAGTRATLEIGFSDHNEENSVARIVTWIPWDSGFRGSGLKVGDLVVGHGDVRYTPDTIDDETRVGEANFGQWFDAQGLAPGDPFHLLVLRESEELRIEGKLGGPRSYRNQEGKALLSNEGPVGYEKDEFDYAWDAWYRQFVDLAKTILAGWDYYASTDTKGLAESLIPLADRIKFLEERYPGPFARAVRQDFEAMTASVAGERRELTTAALAYRSLGDIRAQVIAAAADRAFESFLAETGDSLLTATPNSPNAFEDDISHLIGRTIRLPEIGNREVLFETRKSWFRSGTGTGGYLIDRTSDPVRPLYEAISEYTEKVDPFFADYKVEFVGIVQAEAALVADAYREITVSGVRLVPHAVLVTGASNPEARLFVDLRNAATPEPFAGAHALEQGIERHHLEETDRPEDVLMTAFEALKIGDMETWLSCYADWKLRVSYERDSSYLYVDRTWEVIGSADAASIWDTARQRFNDDVYGVESAKVSLPRRVFDASSQTSASGGPQSVEEVRIVVNHIGKIGDEYRTFAGPMLHRRWDLQRLDEGPWRIVIPYGM
ncbi:MAG: hypothetical protein GEU75_16390 [Dehalococcoidia bacterium]|nr:hypothetical protein [Dehalococcoidia bacterium]